jgi:threonine aldolase
MEFVDLRSDTVTRPTPAMLEAMTAAAVGDDVFGEDPQANALQAEVADLLGVEAALFMPSGTMANEVAIRTHTEPGDEIIVERGSHIYVHEGGAPAALAGVNMCCLCAARGILEAPQVEAAIRNAPDGGHQPYTTLICLETPHNEGGGAVYPLAILDDHLALARKRGIRMHLDGARLFNAAAAMGVPPARIARGFDTVSVCLSKSLGAPVGSLLAGSAETIERAHRFRKMFGGGMRQIGYLAAAGRYALEHHLDRLVEDHEHAYLLAEAAMEGGAGVDMEAVQTNMVYLEVDDGDRVVAALEERGVLCLALDKTRVRLVTHLDVSREEINRACEALHDVL